jgi:aldehyde:ferredoxin oxidoreductase
MADGWFALSKHVSLDARTDYIQGTGIAKGTDCIYSAQMNKLTPFVFTEGLTNPRGGHEANVLCKTHSLFQPLEAVREYAIASGTPDDAIARIFQSGTYFGAFNVGRLTKHMEDSCAAQNSLGICLTMTDACSVSLNDYAELYSAATGIEIDGDELKRCGERGQNLYKLLNDREGFTKKDDSEFPEVWLNPITTPDRREALTDYYRIRELSREDILRLLDDYYDERGWDKETGTPAGEKLRELGLDNLVDY